MKILSMCTNTFHYTFAAVASYITAIHYGFIFYSTICDILLHIYLFCRPCICLHMDACTNLFIKYFFIYDWIRNLRQFLYFDYEIMENQIMRVHVPT